MSQPVQPKPAIPLDDLKAIEPKVPIPLWRWAVAALLAPVVFVLALLPLAIFGQIFNDVPDRYAIVPLTAEVALPLAVTIWALRGVVRPKPKKQRGFPVLQKDVNL